MAENDKAHDDSCAPGTAQPGNGHPVADNPFRMLHGTGWTVPRDLLKTGQKLKLLARHAPITPDEPCPQFCPRQRTEDDYILAARQLADPNECAIALVFKPDEWRHPGTAMGRALLALLEAEHLPSGDTRKAALLQEAILVWEGDDTEPWLANAVRITREQFKLQPDETEVRVRSGQALVRVAEAAIANWGETLGKSEIGLLNTLENCQRLPEIRGLIAAAEAIGEQQFEALRRYLIMATGLQQNRRFSSRGEIDEPELNLLVQECEEAKQAYALLQQRPTLARRLDPRVAYDLAAFTVGLAFTLGLRRGKWEEASVMIFGVSPDDMLAGVAPHMRVQFQLALAATPLMLQAVRREELFGLAAQLEDLRYRYDGCESSINIMKDQLAWLESGRALEEGWKPNDPGSVPSYAQSTEAQRTESGFRFSGWSIFMMLFVFSRLFTTCSPNSSPNSSYTSWPVRPAVQPSPVALPTTPWPASGQPGVSLLSRTPAANSSPATELEPLGVPLLTPAEALAAKQEQLQVISNTLSVAHRELYLLSVTTQRGDSTGQAILKQKAAQLQETERQARLLQSEYDILVKQALTRIIQTQP